jgi:hypothetical protein
MPLESGRRWPGDPSPVRGHRLPRGIGGTHPGRISIVWNVTIPLQSGHGDVAGVLTVREADPVAGEGWPKKRTPAAERQQETGTSWLAPPPVVSHNWPDTSGCSARKGADVGQVSL